MEKLTDFEKNLLLETLKHHMGPDLRLTVMTTLPLIYNKWIDQDVMEVSNRKSGERYSR